MNDPTDRTTGPASRANKPATSTPPTATTSTPNRAAPVGPTKQQMFEAEMLHQQLQRTQEFQERLEQQLIDAGRMRDALAQLPSITEGQELLVPIANGIFLRAIATADTTLLVNSGQDLLVRKSVEDVTRMVDEQTEEIRKYATDLDKEYQAALARLQSIEAEIRQQLE